MKDLVHKIKRYRSQKELTYLIDMLSIEEYKIPQYNPGNTITFDITDNYDEYILFNVNDAAKFIAYNEFNIITLLRDRFDSKNISYTQYKEIIIDAIKISKYSDYKIW